MKAKAREEDRRRIAGHYFQNKWPDDSTWDIAVSIIEDQSGYEIQNQCDDAQNFVTSNAETYFQRVCFILGCCRIKGEEELLRTAIRNIFIEQATDTKPGDHGPDESPEVNGKFIDRMVLAATEDEFITSVVEYIKSRYLGQKPFMMDKKEWIKNRMRLIRGYRIDCENRGVEPGPIPKADFEESEEKEEEEPKMILTAGTLDDDDPLIKKYSNYDLLEDVEEERKDVWRKILNL